MQTVEYAKLARVRLAIFSPRKPRHQVVVRYIHQFLDAYLNQNQTALQWGAQQPSQNGTAEAVGKFEFTRALSRPQPK